MSRTLHMQKRLPSGRVIFRPEEADSQVRQGQDVFDKAQERKKRKADQKLRNMIRAAEGQAIRNEGLLE